MKCRGCMEEYNGKMGKFLWKKESQYIRMLQVSTHIDNCANNFTPKYYIFSILQNVHR